MALPNIEKLLQEIYPVGRGFIDFTDTDYSNYLGFKWERTLLGVSPIGYDPDDSDFNKIGNTGGEKTHKLTGSEMPKHSHLAESAGTSSQGGNNWPVIQYFMSGGWNGDRSTTAGGDQPHNNMHPYEVVAYWKRVK